MILRSCGLIWRLLWTSCYVCAMFFARECSLTIDTSPQHHFCELSQVFSPTKHGDSINHVIRIDWEYRGEWAPSAIAKLVYSLDAFYGL